MEHAQPSFPPAQTDELIKGFLILMLVDGVLSLIMAGVDLSYNGVAPSTPFSWVVNIVSSFLFIFSIVVWVRSAKRNYPKYILWAAILRVMVPIILGFLVFVAGVLFVFSSIDTTMLNADPGMMPEEITSKLKWLSILPAISGVLYIGLGVNSLVKLRKG